MGRKLVKSMTSTKFKKKNHKKKTKNKLSLYSAIPQDGAIYFVICNRKSPYFMLKSNPESANAI